VLRLDRLLAGAEGGRDRVVQRLAVDQRLRELGDRLLAARPEAVLSLVVEPLATIVFEAHPGPFLFGLAVYESIRRD
jgi:hypothetical protein